MSVMTRVAVMCVLLVAARVANAESPAQQPNEKQAVVDTSAGTFVIDLAPDGAPNQTAYFQFARRRSPRSSSSWFTI